ncbi:xaa-Pro aminopeptidase 1-like, partial [Asbolus verrucosus]
MVVTALDEIAWLLNIRSRDIPYSPFVRSYLIVDMFGVMFYVNESQLRKNHIKKHFEQTRGHTRNTVKIKDYNAICNDLKTFSQVYKKILIPSHYVYSLGASRYISNCTNHEKKMLHHQSPIIEMKAKKNPTEIEGMYNAHIRDAAAMCEFFSYFESRVNAGDHFTELDIVKKLNEFRFEQKYSLGNSFRTIAAYGSNGARPHYEPTPNTNAKISKDKTLVLDSGGQYFGNGTTDVTRTLHLGTPTKEQKNAYTRVLIGQIQLSTLTFPENMKTSVADVMARAPLWEVGLDYSHPTSHGIGSFLSVHESPISVYFDDPSFHQKLKPGYFLSNEPGFYKEDDFGIRLENVMEVVEKNLPRVDGISFLGFKVVTLVPYEPKLIDLSLLSFRQRKWLNFYNDQIRRHVGRELRNQNFINGYNWMMEKTKSIPEYGHGNVVRSYSLFVLSANA